MDEKKYFEMGMAPFYKLAESQPLFAGNLDAVDEMIGRMSLQHNNLVNRFGWSYALDLIFLDEVTKYYIAITKIPEDVMKNVVLKLSEPSLNNVVTPEDTYSREKVIIYPTFQHDSVDGAIAHIPCSEAFVIKADSILFKSSDDKSCTPVVVSNFENTSDAINDIFRLVRSAANYWGVENKMSSEEIELLKSDMASKFMNSGYILYKEDFVK